MNSRFIKKKILIIVNKFAQGGTFNSALNFYLGYNKLGYKVQIIFLKKSKSRIDLIKFIKINKIKLYNFKELKKINYPDYIHIIGHGITSDYIYKIKDLFPNSNFFESNIFGKPSSYEHLLSASWQLNQWSNLNYILNGGQKNYGILPLPVNFDQLFKFKNKFKLKNIKTFNKTILRVAQNYPGKWSLELITLFEKIYYLDQNVKLILVTPPKKIINKIKELPFNIKKNIRVISKINSNEEIFELYYKCNLFLHASNQGETFGYVFFESYVFNCPVFSMETPWADNSQVDIVRELFNKKNLFNSFNRLEYKILNKLKYKSRIILKQKILKKYSPIVVCKNSIKLMESRFDKKVKFDKNFLLDQLDNADNFIVPKIKKYFLTLCVIVFSSYSLFLFKKLRRIKMI